MKSYKTISVKAKDLKPGNIFSGRVDEDSYPWQQVVRKITIEKYEDCTDVIIETRKDKKYVVDGNHEFIRELSPAEEAEMSGPDKDVAAEIQQSIERLNTEISDCAFSILDRIEMHTKNLTAIRDGKRYSDLDDAIFATVDDDFKQASETACKLYDCTMSQYGLKEELKELDVEHKENHEV